MNQPQLTASAFFGAGGVPSPAVSPYGVGLGMPIASGPAAGVPAPAAPMPGMNFIPDFIPDSFWTSPGFGLLVLFLLVAYFDVRLLNR